MNPLYAAIASANIDSLIRVHCSLVSATKAA